MALFFIIVFISYCIAVLALAFGWARLNERKTERLVTHNHLLSVVIAFRNESANLSLLIENLEQQQFPKENFEVILVNDHSTDDSLEVISKLSKSWIKVIQLSDQKIGKKAALDFGINYSSGEIIITTDADCRLLPMWLSKINERFQAGNMKMLAGLVRIDESNSFFSQLQAMEFASLMGTTGATFGLGSPTMCNGANLCFRKSAYLEVNGYDGNAEIPSGDDEFLMRKFLSKWKSSVQFLAESEAIVSTASVSSFSQWVHQRLRWAGKWKHNSSSFTRIVAASVLFFHICFITFFALVIAGQFSIKLLAFLWGAKMFTEALFLIPVNSALKLRWRWMSFFVLQFIYPIYVVVIGILSQWKDYKWKGRRWSPVRP
jgi:biofilm PGA synthesis N-glycosyltransferase PgaC